MTTCAATWTTDRPERDGLYLRRLTDARFPVIDVLHKTDTTLTEVSRLPIITRDLEDWCKLYLNPHAPLAELLYIET